MSVQYGIVTAVMPPGGWHYQQQLSSGDTVKLSAFSFEEILENMLEFRLRHLDLCGADKANIAAVRADLKAYMCAHFKANCADSPGPAVSAIGAPASAYQRPIDKAGDWLAKIGNLQFEKVDAALAAERAQICATCPQNVRWQTGCTACNDNVSIRIQNAKGSLYTPYDRRLLTCRVYGHANEVAVWLADTSSTSEHEPPANCWKNK